MAASSRSRGIELVGEGADAVLVGGCDETLEPNQVFSYMNLARAFAEIQMGAGLPAQEPLVADEPRAARRRRVRRRLEYATGVEATVLGKPSLAYFAAALDASAPSPS